MSNSTEHYWRKLPAWRGRRSSDERGLALHIRSGPDGHPKGRSVSAEVIKMLSQKVKVSFANGPLWMKAYDAVVLVLRNRADAGDPKARQLLTDVMTYAGVVGSEQIEVRLPAAPIRSAEKKLAEAFVERTLERSTATPGLAENEPL